MAGFFGGRTFAGRFFLGPFFDASLTTDPAPDTESLTVTRKRGGYFGGQTFAGGTFGGRYFAITSDVSTAAVVARQVPRPRRVAIASPAPASLALVAYPPTVVLLQPLARVEPVVAPTETVFANVEPTPAESGRAQLERILAAHISPSAIPLGPIVAAPRAPIAPITVTAAPHALGFRTFAPMVDARFVAPVVPIIRTVSPARLALATYAPTVEAEHHPPLPPLAVTITPTTRAARQDERDIEAVLLLLATLTP